MMNIDMNRVLNTTSLFGIGAGCAAIGLKAGIKHVTQESLTSLLTTGALVLPVAIMVGIAVHTIFDNLGWQSSPNRDLTLSILTVISALPLSGAAAVGFGLTTSISTALTVTVVISQLGLGLLLGTYGLRNIFLGTNHGFTFA